MSTKPTKSSEMLTPEQISEQQRLRRKRLEEIMKTRPKVKKPTRVPGPTRTNK